MSANIRPKRVVGDDYEPPEDDVSAGISDLLEYLRGCMQPDATKKPSSWRRK